MHHQSCCSIIIGILFRFSVLAYDADEHSQLRPRTPSSFTWSTIPPSHDLDYHECSDSKFRCARLIVPLNWRNASDPRTAILAIQKYPAQVPEGDHSFGGSILTNPGGPGGSGVQWLDEFGPSLQKYVDIPGQRHYEIVSWDPRGVGNSTPSADCFPGNRLARDVLQYQMRANGGLELGIEHVSYGLSLNDAMAESCKQTGDFMAFVTTPSVARDMVQMVDKIDELRKRRRQQSQAKASNGPESDDTSDKNKLPRLHYIGFSYGTIIGNYFRALFPGRVGRMVLDGVVDPVDYTTGPGWEANLYDEEKVLSQFWQGCFKAGPVTCALAKTSDKSAGAIAERYWSWVKQLDNRPHPYLAADGMPLAITGDDARSIASLALYKPIDLFKSTAEILHEAMNGNMTGIVESITQIQISPLKQLCQANTTDLSTLGADAPAAIACGDGEDLRGKNAQWWLDYVQYQLNLSQVSGSRWTNIHFPCSSWPIRSKWTFKGPFTSPESDARGIPGHPTAPLLLLSSRLDPATPLVGAQGVAKAHPGSALVIQEAIGHGVIGTAPSRCVRRIVATYFDTGEVPNQSETGCKIECGPWDEGCSGFG